MLQCKLGGLFWGVTVSRPDIRARLTKIACRINPLCGSDVYRITHLARAVGEWQAATAPTYASSSHPWRNFGFGGKRRDDMRHAGGKLHYGSMSLAGWLDAAYGGQSTQGTRRPGYVIGLMALSLAGICHFSHWTSKFTSKLVRSSLGGGVYAQSGTVGRTTLWRDF